MPLGRSKNRKIWNQVDISTPSLWWSQPDWTNT